MYDDGGSGPTPISASEAEAALTTSRKSRRGSPSAASPRRTSGSSRWSGSTLAHLDPNEPSLLSKLSALPPSLQTRNGKGEIVLSTNEAGFAYGVNVGTSPVNLAAAQVHAGTGIMEAGPGEPWVWNGTGALTPIQRYAEMLSGSGPALSGADGSEWYFPERLTIDTGAVADGNANPARRSSARMRSTGSELPTSLHILAISSELDKLLGGSFSTLTAAETLAAQSGIPPANLTLIDEEEAYAHNDPAGAYPENEFMNHLVPFLEGL